MSDAGSPRQLGHGGGGSCLHPSLPACPGAGSGAGERYLQFGVGSIDQPVAQDGVPVLNVRAAGKSQSHVSPMAPCPTMAPALGGAPTASLATHWKAKVLP